jgi:hypothetical protein
MTFSDYAKASPRWAEAAETASDCPCCGHVATHAGYAGPDAIRLIVGCEWLARLWVRDPFQAETLAARRRPVTEAIRELEAGR